MRLNLITSDAALAALWPQWEDLWRRVPEALPFLAPSWLRPWWAAFGTGAPVVALLCSGEELRGLLPLYCLKNKLLPMGVGISDYFDALIAPSAPEDAASHLLHGALQACPVPQCDLPELPPEAALLAATAPAGWRREIWPGPPCPVLRLNPAPAIPAGMNRDIRQARNRAARAGGFHIRLGTMDTLASDVRVLIRLHTERWHCSGETGVLADAKVQQFHRHAAPGLLHAGHLRLAILELRQREAAAIHALLGETRVYLYLSGFAAEARFESPGTILLSHLLAEAAAEGRSEAHFLRGGEAYKYAWGATDRHNCGASFRRIA